MSILDRTFAVKNGAAVSWLAPKDETIFVDIAMEMGQIYLEMLCIELTEDLHAISC